MTSNKIRYLYDKNGNLLIEKNNNEIDKIYLYGNGIEGYFVPDEENNATFYSFVKNAHGDVVKVKCQTTVLAEYDYDAFGDTVKCEETDISNSVRYAGYYYDYEIDKYYLVNRYYNGATGRFMTEDPYWNVNNMLYGNATDSVIRNVYYPAVVQSGNRFAYCAGKPILFTDANGCSWDWVDNIVARYNLSTTAYKQYPWMAYASIFSPFINAAIELRISTSINQMESHKTTINKYANEYGIPNEIVGGIIFKEQLTQSIPDSVANIHTFFGGSSHSTGLGAIFPETARRSWEYVDSNMVNGLTNQEIQYKLTYDSDFNIKTVVAVLLYEAKELGIIEDVSDAKNITMEEWKQIVAEYNGSDEYANKVFEYLEDADELLD